MADTITLKKYANRRLYDTDQSRYVTLAEVAELIRKGGRVKVLDAKTSEDVTAFILTQIVLEDAKNKKILLPVPLLHLIIQFGDNLLSDFFKNYLQQVVQSYLTYNKSVDAQFKKWLEMGMDVSEMAQKNIQTMNPLQSVFKHFSRDTDGEAPEK